MQAYTSTFHSLDITQLGGKGANLGELTRIKDVQVPDGFCVTTAAFDKVALPGLTELAPLPDDIAAEIKDQLSRFSLDQAFAIRSSATAEDLPFASFAGQHDSYLNITGFENILLHIEKCWASLFTERAVAYRNQNGFDHHSVKLAVIVQKMVPAEAAGVLFTADPVSGNRKVLTIDAGLGLGDALVSGLVNPDGYAVKAGQIIDRRRASPQQVLSDTQILQLEALGRKIEAHFGEPQDIEWCLADNEFYIVQSRSITTLFPIPVTDDQENHVYLSVGHQQMMTDAMKPLGISMWQLITPRPMPDAGGRLFVDITKQLAAPVSRKMLLDMMEEHDPLFYDAIQTVLERGDFITALPDDPASMGPVRASKGKSATDILSKMPDPVTVVHDLIADSEAALAALQKNIAGLSGSALFDFIVADIQALKQSLANGRTLSVIMAGIDAATWLNDKMQEWLGEKEISGVNVVDVNVTDVNVADVLARSVPGNITSEMGLALMDVADAIRPDSSAVASLQQGILPEVPAVNAFLDKYGMRCPGEIDITRPRWREKPTALIPLLLNNIRLFKPNAGHQQFEQGKREALAKEAHILDQLKKLPDGAQKAEETQQMISLLRNTAGYREYPKYSIVSRTFVYKQSLLQEAAHLVKAGVLQNVEDAYYLTFEELRNQQIDPSLIQQRREDFKHFEKLAVPRVLTSDGECITGNYKGKNMPSDAIAGLAVSSGIIEGRARVILNIEDARLEDGDIIITRFTDPSWTPLFVSAKGLVTEVGGLMTHGAVIAREYGLPAVVGVANATKLIKDGQRIRVNGTEGYVQII
jgi:rifampicin phosphotransferase